MKKTVNQRLREFREELRMNPTQFAVSLGVSSSLIQKIETGEKPVSEKVIAALSKWNLSIDWLLEGKGEMTYEAPNVSEQQNSPWKDEAYSNIKEAYNETKRQLNFLQEQYAMLMMMLKDSKMGKFNTFDFTANPKKFVSKVLPS